MQKREVGGLHLNDLTLLSESDLTHSEHRTLKFQLMSLYLIPSKLLPTLLIIIITIIILVLILPTPSCAVFTRLLCIFN